MSSDPAIMDKYAGGYTFNGGVKLEGYKAISTRTPIADMPLLESYVLPLQQHLGNQLKPLVKTGDSVLKGQLIATGEGAVSSTVHASTSGTVTAIEERVVPHPSGLKDWCIAISSDGDDRWVELDPVGKDYCQHPPEDLLEKLRNSGIVGLGGAVFPVDRKIQAGILSLRKLDTLIINGAECEPWITCDQALMQERAEAILRGIEIALYISGASTCLVGIEDNKPQAIKAMTEAARQSTAPVSVIAIPTLYPTGGERQLIKVLTNREVPNDGYPADIGLLVMNVATVWSLQNYILQGQPLISRIVTVTGHGVLKPGNVEARIGSPISTLVKQAGGYAEQVRQLTMGGPMMGFALPSDELPVVKATNCLLADTVSALHKKPDAMACIRCGACAEACPADLLPQQLFWYSRAKNLEVLKSYKLDNCIECGCCDYVCPSHIPLVHYFRYAKAETRNAEIEHHKADIARQRHEARDARLERIKQEKAAKLAAKKAALEKKKKNQPDDKKAAIAEALERAKKRKESLKNQDAEKSRPETGDSTNTSDKPEKDPTGDRDNAV